MPIAAAGVLGLIVPILAVPVAPIGTMPVPDDTHGLSHKTYAVPPRLERGTQRRIPPGDTPAVGAERTWLGLDDLAGRFYRKDYTLRAVGEHIEVWVANDLAFPEGDCRTDRPTITDAQATALVREFDQVIHPRETQAFSTPPERDGTDPRLDGDFTGDGGRTVTLVDNIRDDNYADFPQAVTYIAGFFSHQLNDLVDRNVMTIDAYDWAHRTGANPPDDATGDLCTSRPAKPRLYEGTFAHEWQHLLQSYTDPDEVTWVNEGLSDYAQNLTGYVDSTRGVHHRGADSHLTCFQGFGVVRTPFNPNPRDCGGPQNSLNLWDEGEPTEILADYGIAYQFMLYLRDRFGPSVLSRIHRDGSARGIAGVARALPEPFADVLHDFQVMTLVDKVAGDRDPRFSARSLRSTVNLANPAAYARPGAAPNGADYVRLRTKGRDLRSVEFRGAASFAPSPMTWTAQDGALFSGNAGGADTTAAVEVTVPVADPHLRISTKYGAENRYDYGYVTVSADGGRTWDTVPGDNTADGPLGPGVTGNTGGKFVPHSYDLSAYAGKKVFLGFRYVSDATVNEGGWHVTGIDVGGVEVAADPRLFRSYTQVRPTPVHGWQVTLVGLGKDGFRQVPVERFARLRGYDKIVAVVAHDDPTESIEQYAPYRLTVNGVRQPG